MRSHLAKNKAITFDGFVEDWFLKTERIDLVSNFWNRETVEANRNLGEARLIPLNKVYPDIP
jgi:hypothetical protein